MDLKTFLRSLSLRDRAVFAGRCGTSAGHLRNLSYGYRTCDAGLAIAIERETAGAVTCEELRDDVDWSYLRGRRKRA